MNVDDDLVTFEQLKSLLHYNPDTGQFTWLVTRGTRAAGSEAGSLKRENYVLITINRRSYGAHRLAWLYMTGSFPPKGMEIDHINHDGSDNRWFNLRMVTHKENGRNCKLSVRNTSGHPGVQWCKQTNKWMAVIGVDRKVLGWFGDINEAIAVRKEAARKKGFHKNHGKIPANAAQLMRKDNGN